MATIAILITANGAAWAWFVWSCVRDEIRQLAAKLPLDTPPRVE